METSVTSQAFTDKVLPRLQLVDRLRELGVDKDIAIPQIAVMGDESSGKSSVLENLTHLPLRRSMGLVTTCATLIRMSRAEEWKATVKIVKDQSTTNKKQSDGDDFPTPLELPTAAAVGLKVAEMSATLALNGDVSHDVIEIELQSPDAPNLTVIDLPSIVRTRTENQDKSVSAQVDALLQKYLNQEQTIILAVFPANQDIDTVDILERAQQVDPDGRRTLGVLTHPDLVDRGAETDYVAKVIANKIKPLKLGYVFVKNGSQTELENGKAGELWDEIENNYFTKHPLFSTLEPHRVGTKALAHRLTGLLEKRIEKGLPLIKINVKQQLLNAKEKVKTLGSPPKDKFQMREFLYNEIAFKIIDEISLHKTFAGLLSESRRICEEMRDTVLKTKPIFDVKDDEAIVTLKFYTITVEPGIINTSWPKGRKPPPPQRQVEDLAGILEDLETGREKIARREGSPYFVLTCSGRFLHENDVKSIPVADLECGSTVLNVRDRVRLKRNVAGWTKDTPLTVLSSTTPTADRNDLFETMRENQCRAIPGCLSNEMFDAVMKSYCEMWLAPALRACKAVTDLVNERILARCANNGVGFPKLREAVEEAITRFVKNQSKRSKQFVKTAVGRESHPATLDERPFKRQIPIVDFPQSDDDDSDREPLKTQKTHKRRHVEKSANLHEWISEERENPELLGKASDRTCYVGMDSPACRDVQEMANKVNIYFDTAAHRFTDNVFMELDETLIREVESNLRSVIIGAGGAEVSQLEKLFEQDGSEVGRREHLTNQIRRLKRAMKELDMDYSDVPSFGDDNSENER